MASDVKTLVELLRTEKAPKQLKIGITPLGKPSRGIPYENLYLKERDLAEIAAALKTNTTVESLELYHYYGNEEGILALLSAITAHKTLKKIRLPFCNVLTNASAFALAHCLRENQSLTSLHLNGCHRINDEGVEAIAAELQKNKNLAELSFKVCWSAVTQRGHLALVNAMLSNTSLQVLRFPLVVFTDHTEHNAPLRLLVQKLILPTATLKVLDLSSVLCYTEAYSTELQLLAELIEKTTSLLSLDLSDIYLRKDLHEGVPYLYSDESLLLTKSLARNKSLLDLKLNGCNYREGELAGFAEALQENTTLLRLQLIPREPTKSEAYKVSEAITLIDQRLARNRESRQKGLVPSVILSHSHSASSTLSVSSEPSTKPEKGVDGSTELKERKEKAELLSIPKAKDFGTSLTRIWEGWKHPRETVQMETAERNYKTRMHHDGFSYTHQYYETLRNNDLPFSFLGKEAGVPETTPTTPEGMSTLTFAQQDAITYRLFSGNEESHHQHCRQLTCVIL